MALDRSDPYHISESGSDSVNQEGNSGSSDRKHRRGRSLEVPSKKNHVKPSKESPVESTHTKRRRKDTHSSDTKAETPGSPGHADDDTKGGSISDYILRTMMNDFKEQTKKKLEDIMNSGVVGLSPNVWFNLP